MPSTNKPGMVVYPHNPNSEGSVGRRITSKAGQGQKLKVLPEKYLKQ
jgi:hypothetical protein